MDVSTARARTRRRALVTLTALVLTSAPALAAPVLAATPAPTSADAAADRARSPLSGLLRPVPSGTASAVSAAPAPGVERSQRVVVDAEVLPETPAEAASGVELPLFPDTALVADLEPPTLSPSGYQVWSGTLAGAQDSSVVLVEQRGSLTGHVADADGGSYRIRPAGDGTTVVEQLDTSVYPEAHEHPVPSGISAAASQEDLAHDHSTHDHSTATDDSPLTASAGTGAPVIDVLVAYTTAAKNAKGGQVPMEADVALAVEQTNTAFATSGVAASMRLVHTVEVSQNADVDEVTIGKLANPTDGWNDTVGPLRDQYGADLVALIVDDTASRYCGIAYQMAQDSSTFAPYGYSVTDVQCSTGNSTFAHEIGHNFGAAHDRGSWSGTPAYPYGYDWVDDTAKFRTVMSYTNACNSCTELLRFSNPDQTYGGAPLGAPIGAPNQADNRALLNLTASTVAGFRGAAVPATVTVTSPTAGGRVVAPGRTSVTWSTTGNVGSTVKVELLRGSTPVAVLAAAAPAGTGSLAWSPPATLARGDDYRIQVRSVAAPGVTSASDPFSVVDPSITVTSQRADTSWAAGVPQTVTWAYTGAPTGGVRLELVRDGRVVALLSSAAPLGTAGRGTHTFTTPAGLGSYSDHRVRATLTSLPAATGTSEGTVTTAGTGAVHLTSPVGGESWTAGSLHTVTWSTSGVVGTSVKVELLKGTVPAAVLGTVPAAAGTLSWRAPASLASGADYRVAVTAVSHPGLFDLSDAALGVDGTSVSLAEPPAEWVTGTRGTLTWTTVGAPGTGLRLELVPATGTAVVVAAAAPLAAGTYSWTPPLSVRAGVAYRLRGTVVGNALVTDVTDAQVALRAPGLSLTAPTTATTLTAGAPADIAWAFSDGAASAVTLHLVRGTTATTIASNVATSADGTGSYRWTPALTLTPAADYRVRVTAAGAAAVSTTSTPHELRRPTVALTAPAGITSGSPATVSWRFSDPVTVPVRVTLLRGTTVVATPVASGATAAGSGAATWAVPATLPGGDYVLRVRPAATAGTAVVQSELPVTVDGPTVSVATPSGWARGRAVTASWSYTRWSGPSAKVELLRGGAVVGVLAAAAPQSGGAGTVRWTVPTTATLASTYAVRVTLPGSATATSAPFAVTA